MKRLFTDEQIEEYSLALLKWAYGKTGSHAAAEDLAQEVWVQLYQAIRRAETSENAILQPERYLWKVARYVWCRHLRGTVYCFHPAFVDEQDLPAEETDHSRQHADAEENAFFLQKLRRGLMELNRLQREIMIRFYMEQQPQKQIAVELGVTVSTVKWHLYDTRQRLKEDLMENNEFVYRPHRLHLYISGQTNNFDTINVVNACLSKQNICAACYQKAQTAETLSRMLGIPMEYVDSDLQWLVGKELLMKKGNAYRTAFLIENSDQEQMRYEVYLKMKSELSDAIVNGLMEAEEKIRAIGFHGSDMPMNKLLWLLIYRFADGLVPQDKETEPPIRADGGKYHVGGFDKEAPKRMVLDISQWAWNGAMNGSDGYHWFGMERFGNAEPIKLFELAAGEWKRLQDMLLKVIEGTVDIDQLDKEGRFDLSTLIEKNFVKMDGKKPVANFCTFTSDEYRKLKVQVFWPLARKLEKTYLKLNEALENLCRQQVPEHLSHLRPVAVKMARYNLSPLTTFLAYQDGHLYIPQDEKDGAMLTLMYIKPE